MGTIADKLNKILSTKEAIKQAIISKGVSVSDTDTFADYANKIESITTGGGSATKYGATVDALLGDIDESGILQFPAGEANLVFDGVVEVPSQGLWYKFYKSESIKTVSFPNLTSIGSSGLLDCFYGCTSLTTASTFANLTSITTSGLHSCFRGCTSLTTAPTFANLTSIDSFGLYNCFYECTSLTTAPTVANLTSIDSVGLYNCFKDTKITSLSFPALKSTSFGSYTDQFNIMLSGVTGCTVHFPSNLESVIGSRSDVTSGFGGTNTVVLFDLPATE